MVLIYIFLKINKIDFLKSVYSKFDFLNTRQGRSQDGGGVGRGEHFLPHKFIKRAFMQKCTCVIAPVCVYGRVDMYWGPNKVDMTRSCDL